MCARDKLIVRIMNVYYELESMTIGNIPLLSMTIIITAQPNQIHVQCEQSHLVDCVECQHLSYGNSISPLATVGELVGG